MSDDLKNIKSRSRPLGGAPEVSIPPLDAEPVVGPDGRSMSMSDQAELLKDETNPLSPYYDPDSALLNKTRAGASQMDPHVLRDSRRNPGRPVQARATQGPFGGILPPEALKDPRALRGVGAAYAANQPAWRGKGEKGGQGVLSEETIEGLQALNEFQREAHAEQQRQKEEADRQKEEAETKFFEDELSKFSPSFMNQYQREINELNTPELREATEKRCKPIDVEQLIVDGEARQDVPIISGKFVVTFRTITGEENLEVERLVFGSDEPDIYVFDKLSMMQLCCGLYAINGQVLPNHLNGRTFDLDLFKHKFRKVIVQPLVMLASMGINFTWFDQRTRKLFVDLEPLKNG